MKKTKEKQTKKQEPTYAELKKEVARLNRVLTKMAIKLEQPLNKLCNVYDALDRVEESIEDLIDLHYEERNFE